MEVRLFLDNGNISPAMEISFSGIRYISNWNHPYSTIGIDGVHKPIWIMDVLYYSDHFVGWENGNREDEPIERGNPNTVYVIPMHMVAGIRSTL